MHSISLIQETATSLKQHQQLLINMAMKQAFHVLQLPMLELSEWLKSEIESNPVLEVDLSKESFKENLQFRNRSQEGIEKRRKEHQENLLSATPSLFEHLMGQAPLMFEERTDLQLAELIIGHLNEKGFLETPLEEVAPTVPTHKMQAILETVQSFDPPGIGARNVQECLLLQLKLKQKERSLAFRIIGEYFDDLVHNRLPLISQKLQIPIGALVEIVEQEIAPLDLNPGYKYSPQPAAAIIPDLFFLNVDDKWRIEVNTSHLPKFHIAPIYLQAVQENSLEKQEIHYLRRQFVGGRWLKRIVHQRHQTLHKVGEFLLKKQLAFFNGDKAALVPLSMKEAAEELDVHESTIARAVQNKYVATPLGMFALKSLFKQGMQTMAGEKISNHSLRKMLAKAISEENKQAPLSDEELSAQFRKMGIPCARRTIAKYRTSLKIPSACKRKKWA